MENNTIEFDKIKYLRLKKLHKRAIEQGRDRFLFEESILLTSYAKYLIQYLDGKFIKGVK